jgi:hypothetical protein
MPLNSAHVDLLLQYALLVAGENDEVNERALGPIHLIKYVYLGDLAFAPRNAGDTYTGADWRFHKFGPWSQEVYERIHSALAGIGATHRALPSQYEGKEDWIRWTMRDSQLLQDRERALPGAILLRLQPQIRKFGADTPALLDYVYRTPPMLSAAPGEHLDFAVGSRSTVIARQTFDHAKLSTESSLDIETLDSALAEASTVSRERRSLRYRLSALRDRADRDKNSRHLVDPVKNPRYDEVYREGVAWLEGLAGEPLPEGVMTVQFDDSVWKSSTRKGDDVS